uniref:Ycf34 n=1 Tax=Sciadococcus taiwanensis TaxID=3028030 RepID=A0A9Y1I239_9RHOD|nr:Ycf34 [Sciadococcus taiwanensis]
MCICVNCEHVNNCKMYLQVETQHNQVHLNTNPCFTPRATVIRVNLREQYKGYFIDWDITECLSFTESPGKWIKLLKY